MKTPCVAVLVLHYGQVDLTKACISSILNNDYPSYYILVLDNSGKRQLDEPWFKQHSYTTVYFAKQNMGFAKGCNYLAKKALIKGYDYLLFLNNDTEVKSNLLTDLVGNINLYPKVSALGCRIAYQGDHNKLWFAGGSLHPLFSFTRHPYLNQQRSVLEENAKFSKCDWVTGCCMLVNSKIWQKVGDFDPNYGSYFEDVDWCYRASLAGYQSYVFNQVLLTHKVSASFGKQGSNELSVSRAYYYARNPLLFIKKYKKGLHKYYAVAGQLTFVALYYFGKMLIHGKVLPIKSYLKGLYAGIKY